MSTRERCRQRGTTLIEFALILPFVLVLTVCVIDITRAFYTKNMLVTAAREGVRLLTVNTVADAAAVEARVRAVAQQLNGLSVTSVTVADNGDLVEVTATADFDWLFPNLFTWVGASITDPMPLSASAIMHDELAP